MRLTEKFKMQRVAIALPPPSPPPPQKKTTSLCVCLWSNSVQIIYRGPIACAWQCLHTFVYFCISVFFLNKCLTSKQTNKRTIELTNERKNERKIKCNHAHTPKQIQKHIHRQKTRLSLHVHTMHDLPLSNLILCYSSSDYSNIKFGMKSKYLASKFREVHRQFLTNILGKSLLVRR